MRLGEDAVTGRLGHLSGNAASVAGRRRIYFYPELLFAVYSPILWADESAMAGKICLIFPEKLRRIHKRVASNIALALLPNLV